MMLDKLVRFGEGEDEGKIRCYTDVLIILSNTDLQLQNLITQTVIGSDSKINCFLVKVLLRRNLMNLRDFDSLAALKVKSKGIDDIDSIVDIFKSLIIKEKIFSIFTFNQTIKELSEVQQEFAIKELSLDSEIFIENLKEFLSKDFETIEKSFSKCNMAQEYERIGKDVQLIFGSENQQIFELAIEFIEGAISTQTKEKQA